MLRESRQVPAYHVSAYLASRLLLDVAELEECMRSGDRLTIRARAKLARRSARRALRIASKVAAVRPEIYRLAARVFWLIGKPARAVVWWARGIEECQRLGAGPELARTYMEAGQLTAKAGGCARLNWVSPSTYLERAQTLFAKLDLKWDQAQVEAG